ncbi:MAG: asparagine synthase (glutamine-hydrolyzing) [Candidatus Marinimicrobia bacterium]|nr:asparagine synthase (glutamine-hydrolyzing) [Candidatus Neomarinimicrobiota bacterium]|tara:strand:- start:1282 stop:2799 length:1518 start_codon:yes stop_codon:yes gene_type:complete
MCGLLCIVKPSPKRKNIKKALLLMQHRGPDYTGEYTDENIYLGHNRLSIIDLNDRSNQPYYHNGYRIIYNGEIYNYKELIAEHNLKPSTKSDTEVILLMYMKYGSKCLNFFNGMFTFIIYNKEKNQIFVARDRLGIKPLYYKTIGEEIIFASEISSILQLSPDEFDEFGIRQYRKLRMTLDGYTLYKGIKVFKPGHYMLNSQFIRYWSLKIDRKPEPDLDHLFWLINDSVNLRKRSDVPIGSYLSGGLDSTILSYILKPNFTWTVGFKEMNEFYWSDLANKNLNSEHKKIIIDENTFIDTAKWMINKRKEPLSVPNEVLIYLMTRHVKKENTVILSGEGADELFLGYDRIFRWANESKNLSLAEFDSKYAYGSHKDDEVLDFALSGLPGKTVFDKISYFFQIKHLQGLLRRLDNSTMLCSVEARVPFVDHRLVELIGGTSFEWRMKNSVKDPLKKLFYKIIPDEIIQREKVGFPVPLDLIFKNYNYKKGKPMDAWLEFNLNQLID